MDMDLQKEVESFISRNDLDCELPYRLIDLGIRDGRALKGAIETNRLREREL